MSVLPVGFGASGSTAYQIANSLRLDGSDDYLSRTFGTPTNNKIYTVSVWGKLGSLSAVLPTIIAPSGGGFFAIGDGTNNGVIRFNDGVSCDLLVSTSIVFRDPTAHYHFVVAVDTTQTTASNRVKIYVTNQQLTSFASATYMAQNAAQNFNSAVAHNIGRRADATNYFSGYLSDIYFIDGQALTPSSFGETNADGVWVPKAYSGTYGNNGFHLDFSDGTSTTTLGYDAAGSNDWTLNGMTRAAGVNECWMVDTPTDNFATLNPIGFGANGNRIALSGANLNFSDATTTSYSAVATQAPSSGKWYYEMTSSNTGVYSIGLIDKLTNSESFYRNNGAYSSSFGGGGTTGYSSWTTNDVIGVAWDVDVGKIWFSKNGTWQSGDPSGGTSPTNTFTAGLALAPDLYTDNSAGTKSGSFNFGQRDFSYTPPTGFLPLSTANLPAGGSITTSGTFTGNLSTDGPFVWLNGNPLTMTINGNAVTWGTHADKTAGGFKVRSSSSSYNASGSNTYSVTLAGELFGDETHSPNTAQGNP